MTRTDQSDVELLTLVAAFHAANVQFMNAEAAGDDDELDAASMRRLPIMEQIMSTPAQTSEGAVEKGRIALLILREFLNDEDGPQAAFVLDTLDECFQGPLSLPATT